MAQPYTDLNPALPGGEVIQNTLNYSRGFEADKGTAGAIKLASDTLDMSIKATDQFVKELIREEVTPAVDKERDDTALEASKISTRKDLLNSGVPALVELNGQVDDLSRARVQGGMRDSQYWARLDLIAKQARARWPGYREHIDNTIASLAGTTPANKLVSALLDETQKNSTKTMSEEEKKIYELEKSKEGAYLPDDYVARKAAGKPYSYLELLQYTSSRAKVDANIGTKKAAIELGKSKDEEVNRQTYDLAKFDVGSKIAFAMDPMLKQIERLTTIARDEIARSGGVTPQTDAQARQLLNKARSDLSLEIDKRLEDKAYLNLTRDQRNAIRQDFNDRIAGLENAYVNKDFGLLAARANAIKVFQEADDAVALGDTNIATVGAVNRIAGPQTASLMYTKLLDELAGESPTRQLKAGTQMNRLMLGTTTPYITADGLTKDGLKPSSVAATIKVPLSAINDPKVPDVVKGNIIKSYYGSPQEADTILVNARNPETRRAMFRTLVNPEIAKGIKEYSDKTGNPQYLRNYSTWATNAFITNFKAELGSLDSGMAGPDVKVEFNGTQFVAKPSDDLVKKSQGNPASAGALVVADRLSGLLNGDRLVGVNEAIRNMLPVWEATGIDPKKAVGDILLAYKGSTESSPSGLESYLTKMTNGYRKTIDLLRQPQRLTREQLDGFFADVEKIKTNIQNDDTDPLGSVRGIIDMINKLEYTPGPRESTNVEDVRGSPGRFAQPLLTK